MNYFQVPSGCFRFSFFQDPPLELHRPLLILSRLFSNIVPFNKCSGFTQEGLSQVCITIGLLISKPFVISCEYLCALHCLPSSWNKPYPSESVLPIHNQHDAVLSTLEKNLAIGSNFGLPISKVYKKIFRKST